MSNWTTKQLTILRREYPHRHTERVARMVRHSLSATYQRALKEGLRKTAVYLAGIDSGRLSKLNQKGRAYRFQKGHKTWNKGLSVDIGGEATRFQAGHRPQTWRPIGSERIDRDGILWRKVSDTRDRRSDWKAVHVMIWEAEHGPLPAGKFVVFADRNQKNFDPSNLVAVTRSENMRRNTYHRYPKEVARLIQLRGALNRQIHKRERHAKRQ